MKNFVLAVALTLFAVGESTGYPSQPTYAEPKPQPRPQPKYEAPKPQPKYEAPKSQPKYQAPKPQPKYQAPKSQPKYQAPRPQPKYEAPKSQPKYQAPKPQPKYQAPSYNCKRHEVLVGHECQCKNGYIRFRGLCTRCAYGANWNCKTKSCVCEQGQVYDADTNKCRRVVKEDKSYPSKQQKSYRTSKKTDYPSSKKSDSRSSNTNDYEVRDYGSDSGSYSASGCPKYSHWEKWDPCACNFGFKKYNGKCVPDCRENEVFTPNGGCTCAPGYNKYDGVNCTICPPRSYWEAGECHCEWGLVAQGGRCVEPDSGSRSYHY